MYANAVAAIDRQYAPGHIRHIEDECKNRKKKKQTTTNNA